MSRRSALVATAGAAAATFLFAPGAQAAGVSAAAGLTYSVHGATVNYVPSLTGTQHSGMVGQKTVAQPGPMSYTLDFGDGTSTGGDAGMAQCSTTGVSPLNFSSPTTHTYAKPGRYKVTVSFEYCGEPGHSTATSTYDVVVGPKAAVTPAKPRPVLPKAPTHKGVVTAPAAKAPAMGEGPKVQTDQVTSSTTGDDAALALGLGGAALLGGGLVRKARRH